MIPIKNIYYMLSYVFKALQNGKYQELESEEFENANELMGAILHTGTQLLIKKGLGRDYLEQTESLSLLRGKVDITETINQNSMIRRQLVCEFDEFSVDTTFNQILKRAMTHLLRKDISSELKKKLKRVLLYFQDVSLIHPETIEWNFRFHRHNQVYELLMYICSLMLNTRLPSTAEGGISLKFFEDNQQLYELYERFLLAYFRQEHPHLTAAAPFIPWDLSGEADSLLPVMRTDILLKNGDKELIIDAKYYKEILVGRFEKKSIPPANLYQIYSYVKNRDILETGKVSGMLLYAKTKDITPLKQKYIIGGSDIWVRTLDLDTDFKYIRESLDEIAGILCTDTNEKMSIQ